MSQKPGSVELNVIDEEDEHITNSPFLQVNREVVGAASHSPHTPMEVSLHTSENKLTLPRSSQTPTNTLQHRESPTDDYVRSRPRNIESPLPRQDDGQYNMYSSVHDKVDSQLNAPNFLMLRQVRHEQRPSENDMIQDDILMNIADDDRYDTRLPTHAMHEQLCIDERYQEKKQLIFDELHRVAELMSYFHSRSKRLSSFDSITKTTVTASSAIAALGLYIGIDQDGHAELNRAFYWISLSCSTIATVLGQLTNSWNLSERAHGNATTYRGLHSLHDYVSHTLVRSHLTSEDMDRLLNEMSSRLLLIRDSAETGAFHPTIAPQRPPQSAASPR